MPPHWKLPDPAGSTPSSRRPLYGLDFGQGSTLARRPRRSVVTGDRMMVATRDFATTLDGVVEYLKAGRDFVRASHPIVRRHPEKFRPAAHQKRFRKRSAVRVRELPGGVRA